MVLRKLQFDPQRPADKMQSSSRANNFSIKQPLVPIKTLPGIALHGGRTQCHNISIK